MKGKGFPGLTLAVSKRCLQSHAGAEHSRDPAALGGPQGVGAEHYPRPPAWEAPDAPPTGDGSFVPLPIGEVALTDDVGALWLVGSRDAVSCQRVLTQPRPRADIQPQRLARSDSRNLLR
jgi:hypothetical protein